MNEELAVPQAPGQAEFSFFGLQLINREQPRWHSTGKVLRRHRPEVYRIAVELMGAGKHTVREMCALLHVSHHTLESVAAEQAETLATLRQKAARKNLELHAMSLDRIEELIPRANDCAKLAVTAGILADKSQLLAGEATARIEHNEPADLLQRFETFCQAMEKRAQVREIDVAASEKLVKESADRSDPGDPSIQSDPDGRSETDSKSDVATDPTQESKTDPDDLPNDLTQPGICPTEPGSPAGASAERGEGGVRASERLEPQNP